MSRHSEQEQRVEEALAELLEEGEAACLSALSALLEESTSSVSCSYYRCVPNLPKLSMCRGMSGE
jgi:hypothetical protein